MKKILFIVALMLVCGLTNAQEGSTLEQPMAPALEFPWEQENVGDFAEPVSYVFQREADVLYSVTIKRRIDLREKMNHPLYFPRTPRGSWRSLAQVIFDAMDMQNTENEDALKIYSDEFCRELMNRNTIQENMNYSEVVIGGDVDENGEVLGDKQIQYNLEAQNILGYDVVEVWFFDKQRSLQDVRIMKIMPYFEYDKPGANMGQNEDENEVADNNKSQRQLGWIKYNDLRPYLAKQEVKNIKNNSQRLSLDDLLTWKRMFKGYILAESNVYEDRHVADYISNSRDQMIESDKITEKMRKQEHDLWEF
ncbi:MAG: gliding motility protein GldN [Bacteroidales bacterium]|jgi:gliding motility associated protien GldN|nr:gliding motility protein GldN [Bacteroidales bacterium]